MNAGFAAKKTRRIWPRKFRFRRQRVRHANVHDSLDDYEIMSPDANPEQIVRTKEGIDIYKNVLNSLNKKTKQAFVLNRYKGLTYEQIAVEMEISIGMVRKHMSQALRRLRDGFESYI
ncbi:MAG: sigma-70 family RNA polymerase sigma factor [Deltaproteobacteria bacterium]|nr:sigma-70 family RNA polymerase sigma factor [Deltaproteobacteria bacterium]